MWPSRLKISTGISIGRHVRVSQERGNSARPGIDNRQRHGDSPQGLLYITDHANMTQIYHKNPRQSSDWKTKYLEAFQRLLFLEKLLCYFLWSPLNYISIVSSHLSELIISNFPLQVFFYTTDLFQLN